MEIIHAEAVLGAAMLALLTVYSYVQCYWRHQSLSVNKTKKKKKTPNYTAMFDMDLLTAGSSCGLHHG